MTFTIVFMVVYLYYIVRDMKRIYQDCKKQGAEIQSLQAMVNDIKGVVEMALCQGGGGPAPGPAPVPPPIKTDSVTVTPPVVPAQSPAGSPAPITVTDLPSEASPTAFVDTESVGSEDIRKLVEEGEIEDHEAMDADAEPALALTKDDVVNMKYDQLKEFCKKNNMSIKGSREALINKILTEKNIN